MRLDEISLADLTPLGESLKRHLGKGRYVHFSKQKDRFGVNVGKHHLDPPGVYFYPIDWLWKHEDFHDNMQFATNWPYWFIADINFAPEGLDLDTFTEEQVTALGQRNGWLQAYKEYDAYCPKGPAQKMWSFLKQLTTVTDPNHRMSWLKSLKGMRWIKDSRGIIMSGEPEQVCVIDPRAMRLVETGQQNTMNQHDWEKWSYWQHAVKTMMERLQERHGGAVTWKHKKPQWTVVGPDWSFSVSYTEGYGMGGLMMNWTTGRATDSARISCRVMKDSTMDKVLTLVEERLNDIMAFDGHDLHFTPVVDPEDAKHLFKDYFVDNPKVDVEIANSLKSIWLKSEVVRGKPPVKTLFNMRVDEKDIRINLDVQVNEARVLSFNGCAPEDYEKRFWYYLDMYAKEIARFHPESEHYKKLHETEWEPFLGWLYEQTGLKLLEKFEKSFQEVKNKEELYRQFDWIFDRVGW